MAEMEINYHKRVRIEVATSVKGVKTYSATLEMLDTDQAQVLNESDRLIKELDKRYPPVLTSKEEKSER